MPSKSIELSGTVLKKGRTYVDIYSCDNFRFKEITAISEETQPKSGQTGVGITSLRLAKALPYNQ